MIIDISNLTQLSEFSQTFSDNLIPGDIIYLNGDLGSGKTTLTQMILKNLGYKQRVKSPTYAIYEYYQFSEFHIIHMDLYRLSNPEELFYLGIDELFNNNNIVIIEWPEKGSGVLPLATKSIYIELHDNESRSLKLHIT